MIRERSLVGVVLTRSELKLFPVCESLRDFGFVVNKKKFNSKKRRSCHQLVNIFRHRHHRATSSSSCNIIINTRHQHPPSSFIINSDHHQCGPSTSVIDTGIHHHQSRSSSAVITVIRLSIIREDCRRQRGSSPPAADVEDCRRH